MLKGQKGITLVALVVTIIVLIILAGISVSLLLGNNGILNQAKNAALISNQAEINQQAAMNSAEEQINSIWHQYIDE